MAFNLDISQWTRSVEFVVQNTRKELPDVITRSGLVTLIGGRGVKGAMQRTPRASSAAILSVPIKAVASFVAKRLKEKGITVKRHAFALLVRKEYRRRLAASGYTAYVGWNKAAIALGGTGLHSRAASQVGFANRGYGKKATANDLRAVMVNTAPAADKIGRQALQDALNDAARDMYEHTAAKLESIFAKAR